MSQGCRGDVPRWLGYLISPCRVRSSLRMRALSALSDYAPWLALARLPLLWILSPTRGSARFPSFTATRGSISFGALSRARRVLALTPQLA